MEKYLSPDDSSIQPGDRTDTGDNQAAPDEMSSGDAQSTGDPTSLGGTSSFGHSASDRIDAEAELRDYEGFETMMPEDGRLGLTGIGNTPPDDWAADTGPTRTAEEQEDR